MAAENDLSQPNDPRIAWAAGLFEGEGCFGYTKSTDRWQMIVQMSDLDVLESFKSAVGAGSIAGPYEHKLGTKETWRWTCGGASDVLRVLEELLPWLHARRRERAIEVLVDLRSRRMGKRHVWEATGACHQGHDVADSRNLCVSEDGHLRCVICRRDALNRYIMSEVSI